MPQVQLTDAHPRVAAALAAEISGPVPPGAPDDDGPGPVFEDRTVRLETTFGGAGVLAGDLTPECAAVVTAVLDALSVSRDAEDDRSHEQPPISSLLPPAKAPPWVHATAGRAVPERAASPGTYMSRSASGLGSYGSSMTATTSAGASLIWRAPPAEQRCHSSR